MFVSSGIKWSSFTTVDVIKYPDQKQDRGWGEKEFIWLTVHQRKSRKELKQPDIAHPQSKADKD